VVATYWHKAGDMTSLEDWAQGNYILILGASHKSESALKALNTAIFHRISQLLLDQHRTRPGPPRGSF